MGLLKSLILGLAAGLAAFFPVSSSGILMFGGQLTGLRPDRRLFAAIMLGLFLALLLRLWKDLVRLVYSLAGILQDLFANLQTYVRTRERGNRDYRLVLTGNYRNFLVMLLAAMIPSALLGGLLNRAAQSAWDSFLVTGMMYFITSVILLVSSFMLIPEKGPRQMKLPEALIIGAFEGFTVIPGLSKIAAASSAGFLCGISRRLTVKFSYLLCLFSLLLVLLPGKFQPAFSGTEPSGIPGCLFGFFGAFAAGYLMLNVTPKLISRNHNRIFAACNAALGMAALLFRMQSI